MIFRIFMILFALNMAVFWAKAHGAEPNETIPAIQLARATQAATSHSLRAFDRQQKLTDLGMRLIRWQFRDDRDHAHFASQRIAVSPSISILPQGAAFNVQWHF